MRFTKNSKVSTEVQRYPAFTLAEILIVLGIIGIVAQMTIPSLVRDIQTSVLKTSFKKAYSVVSEAWTQVLAENPGMYNSKGGWTCTWPDGTTTDYSYDDGRSTAIQNKMSIIKTCNGYDCWASNFENNSSGFDVAPCNYSGPSWVTKDGMCWARATCDSTHIMVDTNCSKPPNKIGQDIFSFLLGVDGVVYFAIDDRSTTGLPVSRGSVCPHSNDPVVINGRSVSFKSFLYN